MRVASDGTVLDEYATLVNPERDAGPTHVHGIRAADVIHAPTFGEVAGDVLTLLEGAVFVAHNALFDARFLRAEMARAGHELPDFPALCTMRLAQMADPHIGSRRLYDLCRDFDLDPGTSHTARDDARAAAGLLSACLSQIDGGIGSVLERLGGAPRLPLPDAWPSAPSSRQPFRRQDAARRRARTDGFLSGLIGRLPPSSASGAQALEYQALLDRILEDRRITPEEGTELEALASEIGLTQEQARETNQAYPLDLLRADYSDNLDPICHHHHKPKGAKFGLRKKRRSKRRR